MLYYRSIFLCNCLAGIRLHPRNISLGLKTIKMEKFYISSAEDNVLNISFAYKLPNGLDRNFSLCRRSDEAISASIQRIKANILKSINKKSRKKSVHNLECATDLEVQFLRNEELWNGDSSCLDVFSNPSTRILIDNIEYEISFNSPSVKRLKINACILSGFPTMPKNFESDFCNVSQCKFLWHIETVDETHASDTKKRKRVSDPEFVKVGEGMVFVPSDDCVGRRVKLVCVPSDGETEGQPVECISNPVLPGPTHCHFLENHQLTPQPLGANG